MRILIANDDGIFAPGIRHLAEWAVRHGEVVVCGPKVEQSGKSHAINFIEPFEIGRVDIGVPCEAYSVDSTPADCVRFGIIGLGREYDLVLSGINYGVNMSGDVVYSGTMGAIFEAEHNRHRGIALSVAKDDPLPSFEVLDGILEFILGGSLFEHSALYNVNIPKNPIGTRVTCQGDAYFSDEFFKLEGDMYMQRGHAIPESDPEDIRLDTVAFRKGYISVTPMTMDRTNRLAFDALTRDN